MALFKGTTFAAFSGRPLGTSIKFEKMSVQDITRKKLWAKSGNMCAICKTKLFIPKPTEAEPNIGEECHIISVKKNGPRHKEGLTDYNNYDNLILLCRNHHKEVDELIETYTEDILRNIKQNHENWVNKTLIEANNNHIENQPKFLSRITSGKELLNIVSDCYGYEHDYDEVNNSDEAEYIAHVLQSIFEHGENSEFYDIGNKVKIGYELSELVRQLEQKGYFLFGQKVNKIMKFKDGSTDNWPIATLVIKKKDSDEIISLNVNKK